MTSLPRHYRALPAVPVAVEITPDLTNLTASIRKFDSSVLDIHCPPLPLDDTTRRCLQTESIPQLVKSYSTSTGKHQSLAYAMLQKVLDWLDDPAFVLTLVIRHAASPDSRYRLLAISLMRLVTDPVKLRNSLFSLALDRVPAVRCALIQALPDIKAESKTFESILKSAVYDKSELVQLAASAVLVNLAPQLSTEYSALLKNPKTVESALHKLSEMVEIHVFGSFAEALQIAISHSPDSAAHALIRILPPVVQDSEEEEWFGCAECLSQNCVFIQNLFDFSEHFSDRRRFLQFINGNRSEKWRVRSLMLEQAIKFVALFGDPLVETAVQFAGDAVALVRSLSVLLWVELIKSDVRRAAAVRRLLESGWQMRLVAAKIVGEVGVIEELEGVASELAEDPIRNVRTCLAQRLKGTEWCVKLFGDLDGGDLLLI
jgi:hypothetical protein